MHARIFRKGKEVWLEDLGSTNGTYVNGKKITAVQIRRSDLIQIGGVVMKVTK
jgi:pSer/pThr/pTyr-binding forkhead associated (FHA) protein